MNTLKTIKTIAFLTLITIFLTGCNGKLPGGDARKFPDDPKKRVQQNLKEGRGFTINKAIGDMTGGGGFEFASSNELWKASLDVIDFMPLSSVNYSGGIIITDWYYDNTDPSESIKISIRFLTNEIRSDALEIKVFNRKCRDNLMNCKITESNKILVNEITKEILKKAAIYKKEKASKNRKAKKTN